MESLPALQTKLNNEYSHLFKIVLLGEQGVGKTEFLNRWVEGKHNENYSPTIGVDFKIKHMPYGDKSIKFQVWDTAGQLRYRSISSTYIRGAALIIIFVEQKEFPENKASQIRDWANIADVNWSGVKIAIIETKSDVPEGRPLSRSELADLKIDYAFHQTFSSQTGDDLSTLATNLNSVIPQLITAANNKDNSQKSSAPKSDPVIKEQLNLEHITNIQAKMILISLKEILIHGPLNETNKSYNLSIFGGGKPVVGDDGTACIVPDHVKEWVEQISPIQRQEVAYNKALLSRIFNEINESALNKPFSRSSTTQDFYQNSLPEYIKECVYTKPLSPQFDYFSIRKNITELDEESANTVLQLIKVKLEEGPPIINNNKSSYQLGFFGGKKYTNKDGNTIKVSSHVALILEYIDRKVPYTIPQQKLLTVYHYLVIARHSKCSSRNESTQSFYNTLPIFVADEVNKINPVNKPPVPAHL